MHEDVEWKVLVGLRFTLPYLELRTLHVQRARMSSIVRDLMAYLLKTIRVAPDRRGFRPFKPREDQLLAIVPDNPNQTL
ncbi:MAG: hypothetical protein Ct9H300mP15_19500 [Gemmatimonadota bacterium]|nr:MAG: hypothetical protein Ct9H300mP15_19500 [Gemmatimonadota bacterium]